MYFGKNVRYLRYKNNCSQDELAAYMGYKSFTTIQKWECEENVPSYQKMAKVAAYFNVDVEQLANTDMSIPVNSEIPVLGVVRGGLPILAEQNYLGFEHVYPDDARHSDCFYLEVVGDSMKDARILPGDLLYIHRQASLDNGDIGVVLLDNSEATVKRIFYRKGNMILQPENDAYEPIVLTQKDIEERNVQIIGKVLHNRIKF